MASIRGRSSAGSVSLGSVRDSGRAAGGTARRAASRAGRIGLLAALVVVLGACGRAVVVPPTTTSGPGSAPGTLTGSASYKAFAKPGPYLAGTASFTVGGDRVVIWYPAAPDRKLTPADRYVYHLRAWLPSVVVHLVPKNLADTVVEDAYAGIPAAKGSFPVVLFSHGYGGYPEQSSFLTAHLATWGMIVVAPDQTTRDLSAVTLGTKHTFAVVARTDIAQQLAALRFVEQLSSTSKSLLAGRVDAAEVGTLGHSAGGYTAITTAEADPAIKVAVALAGVPTTPPARRFPILLVSGSADKVVPTSEVRAFYGKLRAPKAFVVIDRTGHNVFDDVCTIAHSKGGVVAAARALRLPIPASLLSLATDGCKPPDIYPPTAWPLIDQVVTAELRFGFGVDTSPIGLGSGIDAAFHGVRASYQAA